MQAMGHSLGTVTTHYIARGPTLLQEIRPSVELTNERVDSNRGQVLSEPVLFTLGARFMVRASKNFILCNFPVDLYRTDPNRVFDEHTKAVSSGLMSKSAE